MILWFRVMLRSDAADNANSKSRVLAQIRQGGEIGIEAVHEAIELVVEAEFWSKSVNESADR